MKTLQCGLQKLLLTKINFLVVGCYAVSCSISHNDPRLCEGQGIELQIFNKPQKMIRNTNVDVTDKALPFAKPMLADGTGNLIELFAGSRSIGSAAEAKGMNVFSIDWQKFDKIDLAIDIEELQTKDVPFIPDVVWASPDCTTYTIAAISTHRNGTEPKSDYAKKCDAVNQHFISLIDEWLLINPKMVFFIENPRGMMRKMPFMQRFKRHTVWYCTYGDDRAKPTDIWTNSEVWKPRPMCHNGNKNCHHQPAPRGSKTGTQGKKGSYNRSKIPTELCQEIIESSILAVV